MEKYKNKDGIELNFGGMSKEGRKGSGGELVQEVVREAINLCSQYNWHDKTSMRFALDNTKQFLIRNFDLRDDE